ncbi:MAG: GSCFA family protein, partial [Cypionkella sp.]
MLHPYRKQPDKAFWKKTISPVHPMDIANWYEKRYAIDGLRIATAGSCFAQHIGRNLRTSGFEYMDTE